MTKRDVAGVRPLLFSNGVILDVVASSGAATDVSLKKTGVSMIRQRPVAGILERARRYRRRVL
ncbi:hypothetical protein M413DRAFT_20995 [Hebeloma cylindrosporum]|uniref:Uncharacterized protein n=1 Tax=Hebeloma cylindrosporum TaxID=76867 RepID=A0A0C3CIY0_HEBCY|nr:hypothetical protein M413DRAFT_20995 [Hebeloma cylindrosporum h7]